MGTGFLDGVKTVKNEHGQYDAASVHFTEANWKEMLYGQLVRVAGATIYILGFFIAPLLWGLYKVKKLFERFF